MSKRVVNCAKDYELILKDKFGNALSRKFILKAGKNELEIPQKGGYYQSLDNERFFIYDGEGELDFENECGEEYEFTKLNIKFLDYFLGHFQTKHHFNADENEKKLIEKFIALMDFNEKFKKPKIVPPYYTSTLTLIFASL